MQSEEITRTPFDRVQRELGGEPTEWEGWYWPDHFGDAVAEHHAIRNDVGVWDCSPLRKWRFTGREALAAADLIFANNMSSLERGQVRYGPFCDASGKMVGDGTVFKFDEQDCMVVTALDSDLDHFNEVTVGLDVEIEPATAATPQLGINGPKSRELLQSLCEADVFSLGYFRFWPARVSVAGVPCLVSRTGYSGELGFELFCSPDDAEQLWKGVVGGGARPYGLAAIETIRIESGLIFIGYDYFQHETSPYDMSLDKLIRLDGSDFCGKHALDTESRKPPRRLVTLVLDGQDVPEYGATVTRDGEFVGTLTSPCSSPTLGHVIGLAVVDSDSAEIGGQVDVAVAAETAAATVAALPIYDTDKERPRG